MKPALTVLLLAVAGGAAALFIHNSADKRSPGSAALSSGSQTSTPLDSQNSADSNAQISSAGTRNHFEPATEADRAADAADEHAIRVAEREKFFQRFDLSELGWQALDDGEFNALVAYLRDDAGLFGQFLDEYRATSDPARARRLAQVLDQFDQPAITTLAEELVFSGSVSSQISGLFLLSGQQQHNPQARDIVSQVLAVESNPQVLSSALNALARPAKVSAAEREKLLGQFEMHMGDQDPAVRRRSLSLISRWAGETDMNQRFINALQDSDAGVRRSALLALVSSGHPDDKVFQALLGVVEDSTADTLTRRTALAALEKQGLSEQQKQRLQAQLSAAQ